MALSVNWLTKVVTIPQADLTLISGTLYEYDVGTTFRTAIKAIEASEEAMGKVDIHNHVTTVSLSGTIYARFVIIINGYSVTFEDGQYGVNLIGANHNFADVLNRNQVSISSQNSAGLVEVKTTDAAKSEIIDNIWAAS